MIKLKFTNVPRGFPLELIAEKLIALNIEAQLTGDVRVDADGHIECTAEYSSEPDYEEIAADAANMHTELIEPLQRYEGAALNFKDKLYEPAAGEQYHGYIDVIGVEDD